MEEKIYFRSGDCELEGLLALSSRERGIVVTHPHPLYGGDMYNVVVETIAMACYRRGYSTLRFNFRGTGRSTGVYDKGRGEQDDVRAAVSYLAKQGINQITLAGYSFGAWVNAHLDCKESGIEKMVMISPPVSFLDFSRISNIPCLSLVVCGDEDEFAPLDRVEKMSARWNPAARLEIISNTDHFYTGAFRELADILGENM